MEDLKCDNCLNTYVGNNCPNAWCVTEKIESQIITPLRTHYIDSESPLKTLDNRFKCIDIPKSPQRISDIPDSPKFPSKMFDHSFKSVIIPTSPQRNKIHKSLDIDQIIEYKPKIHITEGNFFKLQYSEDISDGLMSQIYNMLDYNVDIYFDQYNIIGSELIINTKTLKLPSKCAVCFVSFNKQWNKCSFI